MQWIMSDGGPLICIEAALEASWGGISRSSMPWSGAENDYDRACQSSAYAFALPLPDGAALILNSGPLDTSVWTAPSGALCLVSVICAEPEVDEPRKLALMDEAIFDHPLATTEVVFATSELAIFDSAYQGNEIDKPSIRFQVAPGRYRVLSQTYDPDGDASFIVHKFQPSGLGRVSSHYASEGPGGPPRGGG